MVNGGWGAGCDRSWVRGGSKNWKVVSHLFFNHFFNSAPNYLLRGGLQTRGGHTKEDCKLSITHKKLDMCPSMLTAQAELTLEAEGSESKPEWEGWKQPTDNSPSFTTTCGTTHQAQRWKIVAALKELTEHGLS